MVYAPFQSPSPKSPKTPYNTQSSRDDCSHSPSQKISVSIHQKLRMKYYRQKKVHYIVYQYLKAKIPNVVYIDGDELRELFGATSYDKNGRIDMALKRAKLAHILSSQGIVCVVSTISMFEPIYAYNRTHLPHYFEVYIQCPFDELIKRDQKGLYSGGLNGEIRDIVGIDIAFDEPKPHLCIDNSKTENLQAKAKQILDSLPSLLK
ncbi:MAG: adenylyl-sulfate kinase [Helicobacter sp.]|uniref:adenylyl-sulfate kinase n=2 Tax=Helicobacter TaxID=209 RepID=UPI003752F750|nr:adenylyl-sulfate kinase [Helicobacter sp.]